MKKNKGFTLIELMVAVTIVAMLTAIAMVTFTAANKKARDSRRRSDLEKVRMALEMYRQENSMYPAAMSSLVPTYLQESPVGPKSDTYVYTRGVGSSFTYTLDASLEDVGTTTGSYGAGCGTNACNYRVQNP